MLTPEETTELAARWGLARRAALAAVLGPLSSDATESVQVLAATSVDGGRLLRGVFENSLALGRGCARFHRAQLPLGELPALLPKLGVPCLQGTWCSDGAECCTLERNGCALGPSAARCDYFAEATHGLVLGLTGALHARHRSLARGEGCVDAFFQEPTHPLRLGPLPDEVARRLAPIRRLIGLDGRAEARFRGFNDGALFYELNTGGRPELEPRLHATLARAVEARLPGLVLVDLSPRGIFESDQRQAVTR